MTTLLSFLICLLFIMYFTYIKIFNLYITAILTLSLVVVFTLNDYLFSSYLFIDQYEYYYFLQNWRNYELFDDIRQINNFEFMSDFSDRTTTKLTTLIYSFLPLPMPESLFAFAFFNKLILIMIIYLVAKKNILSRTNLILFTCYPSLHLYSSLALRDILVLFFMIILLIYSFKKDLLSYIFVIISFIVLFLIKWQNFYLIIFILFSKFLLNIKIIKKNIILLIIIMPIPMLYIFNFLFVDYFNISYLNFYSIDVQLSDTVEYNPINGMLDLALKLVRGSIFFYFTPIGANNLNFLEFTQISENIIVTLFIIYFVNMNYKIDKYKTLYWIFLILMCFSLYSLIVTNAGTISRWRFPFIVFFILGLSLDNKFNKIK